MSKPKVLISDALSPRAVEIFKERGVDADVRTGLKPEELNALIANYDGLAIRSSTKVTKDVLKTAQRLRVVGRAGIGVDNVDVPAATERGVVVMNTPFGNSITTAEHAIALMFALARQLPAANVSTHAGKWEKNRFMGTEVSGKTLGIIGCGNIGSIVADRALGLKMKVLAYDPFLSEERAKDLGVEKVELEALLPRADFIPLHTPMTDATKNILNAASLAKCRKGVRVINCARGGLINEADLKAALDSGQVAGAALDVFPVEPAKESIFFGMESVICTPHLGASTTEAQENVALQIAEQMSDFLLNGAVVNALNMPSVSAEDAGKLKPYMRLAEFLGSYCGQLADASLKEISVEYEGHVGELNTKPLTALVLMSLLRPQLEAVNMVSAPAVAASRNIRVSETRRDRSPDYHTLIRVKMVADQGTYIAAGSLFAGKPRIVALGDFNVEAEPAVNILYVRNEDKPGFIGRLGSLLGSSGVNIANFNLGRNAPGDQALALVTVDQPIPPALLEKISKLEGVLKARVLHFKSNGY
ncbi:MAG: phosphoglycerate dehydrogenase [Proteobacteria bacterium]|nr:phosphoglycerate dehydrogenase [Pseudomonadota bacterium]